MRKGLVAIFVFAAVSLANAQCPTSSSGSSPIAGALSPLVYGKVQTRAPIASDFEVARGGLNYVDTEFYNDGTSKYHYFRIIKNTLDFTKTYQVKDAAKVLPPGTTIDLGGARYCPDRIVLSYSPPDFDHDYGIQMGTISLVLASGYETWPVERIVAFLHKIVSVPNTTSPSSVVASADSPQTFLPAIFKSQFATKGQLYLNSDGTFTRDGDFVGSGNFEVNGDVLSLIYSDGDPAAWKIDAGGNKLYNDSGILLFLRRADTPSAKAEPEPAPEPVAPAVAPLRLPSAYVNAQSPEDKLQLNADNSFSLREGGQPYHGSFVLTGSAIELNISEDSAKTTLNRQGDNLTDSSGQTWSYKEQSAGTVLGGAVLHNQDIIKLAKVGIDDATITAKIKGSKCQFDTSTDALVMLKKSGVSATVLKAMVGAGK